MIYTVRPISDRTAFTGRHKLSPFSSTWTSTTILLDHELRQLRARDVVMELDVREDQIRLDGMVKDGAAAASPGVRLAFESKHGPLVYATDAFVRGQATAYVGSAEVGNRQVRPTMPQDWQHNLYAIARGLEALRKVDRYGVVRRGEQYAGFKQLGAGTALPASHMTSEAAWRALADVIGDPAIAVTRPDPAAVVKRARLLTHPDRHNGGRTAWDQVEEAAKVLGVIA